ncbi:acetyl-CoA synthetase-like protein [Aureobasidium pullulans]|uniref:gluconokinase n=1 Tax=Aureobasidium pullulans TaxID=5580 RepID=A0A4S9F2G7_AURPU|nr:acetyl-CoA synthetase-like protein [Aureobasidium pullulans]
MLATPTISLPRVAGLTQPTIKTAATASTIEFLQDEEPKTINDLIRLRAQEDCSDEPIVAYPSSGTNYVHYTPKQLDAFAERAASHYSAFIPQRTSSSDPVHVIGLLGPSNLEYLITLLAITRLGHTVLFLSTRISEEAYVSLLNSTKATTLLVDNAFQSMGKKIQGQCPVSVQPVCSRFDYDGSKPTTSLPKAYLDRNIENSNIAWIIHSSGSSGLPKPIYQTHAGNLRNYANNFGLRGYITLPLFHAHGISCLFRAIHSRKLIYMYNADLPLTAPHLVATLKSHDIQILYAVPYALKLLAESEEGVKLLASLHLVMFGGSACPKPIGDKLTAQGVLLVSHYGTTETGQLMTSFRDRADKDWDFVRPADNLKPFLRWEEQAAGSGIYELVILKGWPSLVASNRSDDAYATKDLFEAHPTTPHAWRYYARLDDTLVLENGEKANPLFVEGVARENRNVAEALAFGANKPRIGLFLIPAESTACKTNEELIDTVWPAIEKSNDQVPAFSRLSKDMVKVLPKDLVYRKTDKGTVIRAAFYRDYKDLIEDAYHENELSGSEILEGDDLLAFLRARLLEITNFADKSVLQDDTDLFSLGVDSLQSIRLRKSILETLDVGGQKVSQNFVFENPSLTAMAEELTRLRTGAVKKDLPTVEERMAALIEKYSDFPQHVAGDKPSPAGQHVVVTGATGSLGAHVVAQLVRQESVTKIYCLVRASSQAIGQKRVRQSLMERHVYHMLSASALRKLVVLPATFAEPHLGLSDRVYEQLSSEVTGVLHCAWSVNFNMGLESFEKDCIAGTRHLIDLCLSSTRETPARLAFCSSVSAVARTPGNIAPEDLPDSLSHAQGMGYAQSKLVTEHICRRAASQTGMSARVVRVGQIVADTRQGIWNATEAIPMIFQTAVTVGALPALDETPSWTPVDIIASSLVESLASKEDAGVINLTNPASFHWTKDLLPLLKQAGLNFETVKKRTWLARLRVSNPDPTVNPPIKLLDFFTAKYDNDAKGRKLSYATAKAEACAPSLSSAGKLSFELVQKFVNYFQNNCWNSPEKKQAKQTVLVIAGPCGTGKTTVATAIAEKMSLAYIEGDALHTPEAREQMAQGIALKDSDRWEWLARLRKAAALSLLETKASAVVVTCSALRQVYRDSLRQVTEEGNFDIKFLLLLGHEEELKRRTEVRAVEEGHYMKPEMVVGQLATLESPGEAEVDVVPIDTVKAKEVVVAEVEEIVREMLT